MEKQHKTFELIANLIARSTKRDTLQDIISNKPHADKSLRKDPLGNFVIRSIHDQPSDDVSSGSKDTQSKNSD